MKKISFRPFRAFRPRDDIAEVLTCQPYNQTNTQEARTCALGNQASFLHVLKPEINLDDSVKPYDAIAGQKGREFLQNLIKQGLLVQDDQPSFYLYQQRKNGTRHVCLIGEVAVQGYQDGLIKGHEKTIPEKVYGIENFTKIQNAHVDPVLLTYRANGTLKRFMTKHIKTTPTQRFTSESDDFTHTIWQVSDPACVKTLNQAFDTISTTYIADGHHRSAVAQRMKLSVDQNDPHHPYNHLLAAVTPDSFVHLADYSRVIKDLNGLPKDDFLRKLEEKFTLKKVKSCDQAQPKKPHYFGMYLDGEWYKVATKEHILKQRYDDPLKLIDMTILNDLVIEPVLEIDTLFHSDRIECVGGLSCTHRLEQKCKDMKWQLAFALHPVPMKHFMNVVDSGQLMPAKTTWFEPKMRPGLVVRMLEDI